MVLSLRCGVIFRISIPMWNPGNLTTVLIWEIVMKNAALYEVL